MLNVLIAESYIIFMISIIDIAPNMETGIKFIGFFVPKYLPKLIKAILRQI